MRLKKFFALLLSMVLMISAVYVPVSAREAQLTNDGEHEIIDFLSLKYERPDFTDVEKRLKGLADLYDDHENSEKIYKELAIIEDEITEIANMYSLSYYFYYTNAKDEYWIEENKFIEAAWQDLYNLYYEKLHGLCKSPCNDAAIAFYGEGEVKSFLEKDVPIPEDGEIRKNISALTKEIFAYEPEVEILGKTYTEESFMKEYQSGEMSDLTASVVAQKLITTIGEGYSEYYFALIKLYNELAKNHGYDNYLDYAYKEQFKRTDTPAETIKICEAVLNNLNRYHTIFQYYESPWFKTETTDCFDEGYQECLGEIMEKMTPEFKESFDYMMATNSLVIVPNGGVINSYTFEIPGYHLPYICMQEEENSFYTMRTLFHEFGHYNADYWAFEDSGFSNLDIQEMYSHGMELLATKYYDEIYNDAADAAKKIIVAYMAGLLYSVAYETELEYVAFTGDYKDPQELYKAIQKVNDKYFYGYLPQWYSTSQFYDNPGYMRSYMTTLLSAMELYLMAEEDYDKALDSYIRLIDNYKYKTEEAFEKSGFTGKWTDEKTDDILKKFLPYILDNEAPVIEGVEDGAVYTEAVDIKIRDVATIYILMTDGEKNISVTSRNFQVGGSNNPIEITAQDSFGNISKVTFRVEPSPFTVKSELNTAGEHMLSWGKVANADSYRVYGAPVGEKYKKLGTVKGTNTSFVNKKADDRVWKYYVVAISKDENGKNVKLAKSYKSFLVSESNKTYTNIKSIELSGKENITIKAGKSKTLSAKITSWSDDKKVFSGKSVKEVTYYTSDENIAKVNGKGKITAVNKGTCYIYCISENGLIDKVKVKVK